MNTSKFIKFIITAFIIPSLLFISFVSFKNVINTKESNVEEIHLRYRRLVGEPITYEQELIRDYIIYGKGDEQELLLLDLNELMFK